MSKFSVELRKKRQETHTSQKQLAERLNIGQSNIAKYENGSQTPSAKQLLPIADFLEMSVSSLISLL